MLAVGKIVTCMEKEPTLGKTAVSMMEIIFMTKNMASAVTCGPMAAST